MFIKFPCWCWSRTITCALSGLWRTKFRCGSELYQLFQSLWKLVGSLVLFLDCINCVQWVDHFIDCWFEMLRSVVISLFGIILSSKCGDGGSIHLITTLMFFYGIEAFRDLSRVITPGSLFYQNIAQIVWKMSWRKKLWLFLPGQRQSVEHFCNLWRRSANNTMNMLMVKCA